MREHKTFFGRLKTFTMWVVGVYACLLIFDFAYVKITGQTPQTSLLVVTYSNITSASKLDGCSATYPCIDNRSQFVKQSSQISYRAISSGAGSWSVDMQWADNSTAGPWTSFGSTAQVDQTSTSGIGYGIGPSSIQKPYHDYIRFVMTGNVIIQNYSGTRQFWWLPSVAAVAFPITATQGGTVGAFVVDQLYATPALGCSAAVSSGITYLLTSSWTSVPSQTMACNIQALNGGKIKPASGQTVALSGSFNGDRTQHFDLSASGAVSLTSASIISIYPEWWGAVGDGSTDSTAAMQAAISSLKSPVVFGCNSLYGVTSEIYVPVANVGLNIQSGCSQQGFSAVAGGGLIALSGFSGTSVLKIIAFNVLMNNLLVNCKGHAPIGILYANSGAGQTNFTQARECTGDGIQINDFGTPATTTSSIITASSSTSFTVAATALTGITIGGSQCGVLVLAPGTSLQEFVTISSVVGLTVNISGTTTYSHASGITTQCNGNNNNVYFNNVQGVSNSGWGFDVKWGTDVNGIISNNPQMTGNTLGGEVWSGSVNIHTGGHSETNGGPAMQLGDLTGQGTNGTNGRSTSQMQVGPFGDLENNTTPEDAVVSICDNFSTVTFADPSFFTPKPAGSACTGLANGVNTMGVGNCSSFAGYRQFCTKNANGTAVVQAGVPGVTTLAYMQWLAADGSTVLNTCGIGDTSDPCYLDTPLQINGTVRQLKPINQVTECTGVGTPAGCPGASANNAWVGILRDQSGALMTITGNTQIFTTFTHSLQAGSNTLDLNNSGPLAVVGALSSANLATGISANIPLHLTRAGGASAWFVDQVR